jgi:hypothetical protein
MKFSGLLVERLRVQRLLEPLDDSSLSTVFCQLKLIARSLQRFVML